MTKASFVDRLLAWPISLFHLLMCFGAPKVSLVGTAKHGFVRYEFDDETRAPEYVRDSVHMRRVEEAVRAGRVETIDRFNADALPGVRRIRCGFDPDEPNYGSLVPPYRTIGALGARGHSYQAYRLLLLPILGYSPKESRLGCLGIVFGTFAVFTMLLMWDDVAVAFDSLLFRMGYR